MARKVTTPIGQFTKKQRRRKRKKMTVTEKYSRLQTGLKFYGIELKELKKATSKALKEAQKIYRQARKQLKEEGYTELPTITQAAKEIKRRETEAEIPIAPKEPEREPLPYADENETLDRFTDFPIIEEFKQAILNAIDEVQYNFGDARLSTYAKSYVDELTHVYELLNQVLDVVDLEEFANWLANSPEYERFMSEQWRDSDEVASVIGEMAEALEGILNDYKGYAKENNVFIPQNAINLDNI